MATEWKCRCKDCDEEFSYSHATSAAGRARGHSRPERCLDCRKHHGRENNAVAQPYFKLRPIVRGLDHTRIAAPLGRLNNKRREHTRRQARKQRQRWFLRHHSRSRYTPV